MNTTARSDPLTLSNVVETLARLGCDPQERRGEYLAHCPAHDDNRASLSVSAGDDRSVVWYCHAGCSQEDVMDVLLGNRSPVQRSGRSSSRKRSRPAPSYGPITWYDYRDEEGNLLYQHGRTRDKQFPFRMPDGNWGLGNDVRRVPYYLRELAAAPAGSFVFVVEGEKDADRLVSLGLLATCNDNGAGKWNEDFSHYFAGLQVVILPDNDEPGRKHAQLVAGNLHDAAESVRVVDLPDLPEKGDVSDWLDADHNAGELLALCTEMRPWRPPQALADDSALAWRYRAIKEGLVSYRPGGSDRGQEFFGPGAAMALPFEPEEEKTAAHSHVTGEYHQHPHGHRCKSYWRSPFDQEGNITGVYKVRYEAWREIRLKKGEILHCSACWHDRVLGACEEIERIGLFYREWTALRYTVVATDKYRALSARIRKHNQRHETPVNYTSFPMESGRTVVLHDAPDWLAGATLPTERPRLYALVSRWMKTPKGKRAGRGFSSWGVDDADKNKKKGRKGGNDKPKHAGYLFGNGYGRIASLVAAYLDVSPHQRATKTPGLTVDELQNLLDAAGIDYGLEGNLPGVTDNTGEPIDTTLNRDTLFVAELPFKDSGGMPALKPPEPAPIYL